MADRVRILFIHGIGDQEDDFWDKKKKPLVKALKKKGIKVSSADGVLYSRIAGDNVAKYWQSMDLKADIDFDFLRKLIMDYAADATVYGTKTYKASSNYQSIHRYLHNELSKCLEKMEPDEKLIIRAHSFGCHIISNMIYDIQNKKGIYDPKGENPFTPPPTLEEKLLLFATSGCNIPLFTAGLSEPTPFAKPGAVFEWLNIYDKDDVLGWPLKPLGGAFDVPWISDCIENTGGLIKSHGHYWYDRDVNNLIAERTALLLQ